MDKRPEFVQDGYIDLDIFLNLGLLVSALWFSKVTLESILELSVVSIMTTKNILVATLF